MENRLPYPSDLLELEQWFPTEDACREYLVKLRWGDGFRCPSCGHDKAFELSRGLLQCAQCRRQTSVTAGTVFQDTRKPLRMWFKAMWHVTNEKNGVSAMSLQRALGLKSYQTAWVWLQKLRRAMIRPGRDLLSGIIEVDETYVGGFELGVKGRGAQTKALVVIAAQVVEDRIGRIRLRVVPDASGDSLTGFIRSVVEPGSTVRTDGWPGYAGLCRAGFSHEPCVLKGKNRDAATELFPRVHLVASLLKRWLLGTHQGAVSGEHLDYYLDEFTFRFNRRKSKNRGLLFYRLISQAVQIDPVPYKDLIAKHDSSTSIAVSITDH